MSSLSTQRSAVLAAVQDASRRPGGCPAGILDSVCARRSAGRQVGTKEWSLLRSNKGMGLSCCGHLQGLVIGIEQDLSLEQSEEDRQQTVGDSAQCPGVTVTSTSQFGVTSFTGRIVLNGTACPVI